jgi:hypothetical protein
MTWAAVSNPVPTGTAMSAPSASTAPAKLARSIVSPGSSRPM